MKFYILNDIDCPDEANVVQQIGNSETCEYLHPDLWDYGALQLSELSTPLEDFGFDITIDGDEAIFEKVRPSTATYNNGEVRVWQGSHKFTLKITPYRQVKRVLAVKLNLPVPDWANWLATDANGDTYFYKSKPKPILDEALDEASWDKRDKHIYAYYKPSENNWKNSLVKL